MSFRSKRTCVIGSLGLLLFILVSPSAATSSSNLSLLLIPILSGDSTRVEVPSAPVLPLFSLQWPFPRNTEIGAINFFDLDQDSNYDPHTNDCNGMSLDYFCRNSSGPINFQEYAVGQGRYAVSNGDDGHRGIDYFVPAGTEVLASADGMVTLEYSEPIQRDRVKVVHDNGWVTIYAHSLIRDEGLDRKRVKAGDRIAVITEQPREVESGVITLNGKDFLELHFEIYRPNPENQSGYSSVDPYYGECSNAAANPERRTLFSNGAPLDFLAEYLK